MDIAGSLIAPRSGTASSRILSLYRSLSTFLAIPSTLHPGLLPGSISTRRSRSLSAPASLRATGPKIRGLVAW